MGDVGVNGHTMQISPADRAAIAKVCGAMKCAVLVVSGRPLDVTGIAPQANALVASWLPGSEGAGVADVLTGKRAFTGRLPVTWAKAESQQPINVGDRDYDPLYPYGWGLRTDDTRARLAALRTRLQQQGRHHAADLLTKALATGYGQHGSATRPLLVLRALRKAAEMFGQPAYSFAQRDALASVARDIVEARIAAGGSHAMTKTAKLTSNAEHQLMSGHPGPAVSDLLAAWKAI